MVGVSVSEMQLGNVQYLMARKLCLCKNIKSEMFEKIFCKIYSGIKRYDLAKKFAHKTLVWNSAFYRYYILAREIS